MIIRFLPINKIHSDTWQIIVSICLSIGWALQTTPVSIGRAAYFKKYLLAKKQ